MAKRQQSADRTPAPLDGQPHVVIVGAGFGGLACAYALGGSAARVTVVDRRNYNLFVPLLYQVATAALSPADIATPIRRVLARFKNIDVIMAEVVGLDLKAKRVRLADKGHVPFDILVLATGSVYNYFGHEDWARNAPGLKTIDNARSIRGRILQAFEDAEKAGDPDRQAELMTVAIVGGGPTGVEIAGAISELARHSLASDFQRIDPERARILLIEAGPKLLAHFPDPLPAYALKTLQSAGVEVRLNTKVEAIEPAAIRAGGEHIRAATIVWGAGIRGGDGAGWVKAPADHAGRIRVAPDLSVPGTDGIYALGDLASLDQDGKPLPALAQVAKQQGRHLGRALRRSLDHGPPPPAFHFHDRGDTAVIGRHAAVYSIGRLQMAGLLAWLLWALVHVFLLIGVDKRMLVVTQWAWRYLTNERGARLID